MANELKLKLAIEGGKLVSAEIDGVTTRIDALGGSAQATASATRAMAQSMESSRSEMVRAQSVTVGFIKALERQNATFGMSAAQIARYDANVLGMNASQRTHTDQLLRTAEANEANARANAANAKSAAAQATSTDAAASSALNLTTVMQGLMTVGAAMALVKMADAATTLQTQLRLSSSSAAEASKAYSALFDIAQQGRVSFTELGTTYAAIARSGKELGISQSRLLDVTQSISQAMTIGGGSAASMQAALVQLGQGLSSGTLRGEELNSIMEQTPRLAKAIADGLGVPIGELRKLGETGQLTSQQVISALEKAGPALAKEMESATLTVGQAFTMLTNSTVKFVGEADKASGASAALSTALKDVSTNIDQIGSTLSEHQGAFAVLTSGALGAAGAAGVALLIPGLREVTLLVAGIGAIVGSGVGVATWLSGTESIQKASLRQLANQIKLIEERTQLGGYATARDQAEADTRLALLKREHGALLQNMAANRQAANSSQGAALAATNSRSAHAQLASAARDSTEKDAKAVASLLTKSSGVPQGYIDRMKEIGDLNAKGALSTDQLAAALDGAHAMLKKGTHGVSESAKAQKLLNDLNSEAMGFKGDFAEKWVSISKGIDATQGLTAAQKELLSQQPVMVDAAKAEAKAIDEATKAAQKRADLRGKEDEGIAKYLADQQAAAVATVKSIDDKISALQADTEAQALSRSAHISLAAAIETVTIARLEEKAATLNPGTELVGLSAEIAKRKELLAVIKGKDVAAEWQKTSETIRDSLTDAFMGAIDSGKSLFVSLRDSVVGMFKSMVLRPMIQATIGSAFGLGSGAAAAGGSGGSTLGAAANLSTLYNSLAGGLNVGMQSGVALASLAAKAGSQMVAGFAGGMVSTASMASASAAASAGGSAMAGLIAGSVMNGLAGYGISKGLSGGYSIDGLNVNAIAAIASMIPGVGPIAGLIGAAVNRAFGHGATEVQAQGTRGTFAASGDFSGTNYTNYKQAGGWFTQDKHWSDTSAVDQKQLTAWSDAFVGIKVASAGMAASLGLATDKISAYSKTVDVAAGTTTEQMTALFVGMADDMATASAPGLEMLVRVGETASVTLGRLSSSLVTVNQWLGALDQKLMAVSLIGGDFASQLADTFGSMDKLTTASKAYYDSFWTDAERMADTATNVAKGLALVGQAMPASKAAFRAVVSGLDLTTTAGRNTYAVMLALAPEFATVADAAVAATKLITDAFDKLQTSLTGLLASITSERTSVADAKYSIINPNPKTLAQLQADVAAASLSRPTTSGMANAASAQSRAEMLRYEAEQNVASATGYRNSVAATGAQRMEAVANGQASILTTLDKARAAVAGFAGWAGIKIADSFAYNASTNRLADGRVTSTWDNGAAYVPSMINSADWQTLAGGNTQLANQEATALAVKGYVDKNNADAEANLTLRISTLNAATAAKVAADTAAQKALDDYTAAINVYASDASKAVTTLGKLREETVAYYEAQKALADGMASSATNLRTAALAVRTGQLDSTQSLAQKKAEFSKNYSMALATTGSTQAGYADKLAAALPDLSAALANTATTRAEWVLATAALTAQSTTVANALDAGATALSYEANSLSLLTTIDSALAVMQSDAGIISAAIKAGADQSSNGTAAIINAILGNTAAPNPASWVPTSAKPVLLTAGEPAVAIYPGYAVGSNYIPFDHTARVHAGEEITPRPYVDQQRAARDETNNLLRRLLASNEALERDNANMRRELRAVATHAATSSKALRDIKDRGVTVNTDADRPLNVVQ